MNALILNVASNGLRLGMVLSLPAVGESASQRAGILNLGVEGVILSAGVGAFAVATRTGPVEATLAGIMIGLVTTALIGVLVITLQCNQIVATFGVFLIAQAIADVAFDEILRSGSAQVVGFDVVNRELINVPVVGILARQSPVFVVAALAIAVVWRALSRTTFGLRIRAVGDDADAAASAGIDVVRTRWLALLMSGVLTSLAGTMLVLSDRTGFFTPAGIGGRGWIAIGLVFVGRWQPTLVVWTAMFFGLIEAAQIQLQSLAGGTVSVMPFELLQALPYIATLFLIAPIVASRHGTHGPGTLGVPYRGQL